MSDLSFSDSSASNKPAILAIDIGTSSIKGGVVNLDGELVRWHRVPLLASAEADLENWSSSLWVRGVSEICQILGGDPSIAGIVVSGNGPTIIPVGTDGSALGITLHWADKRVIPAETPSFLLPRILWLKENRPEIYDQTKFFLNCSDYINYLFTGEPLIPVPSKEYEPFFWDHASLLRLGLDQEKFPPFVNLGHPMGSVTEKGAEIFGIRPGIAVFGGGGDYLSSLLGTGSVEEGIVNDRAGTSEGINFCSETPVPDRRLRCLPGVIPGQYNISGILSSTGRIFEWYRSFSGQSGTSYQEMLAEAAALGHGDSRPLFFPSAHSRETWEFSEGMFFDLEPTHGKAQMGRAVIESIGFAVRDLVETLEQAGCGFKELRVSGGQGRNDIWNQMKADIIGKTIAVPRIIDTELTGNACIGFTGLDRYGSHSEASRALVRLEKRFEPRQTEFDKFSDGYRRYCFLRSRLLGVVQEFKSLKQVTLGDFSG